jgi:hypothetical protein
MQFIPRPCGTGKSRSPTPARSADKSVGRRATKRNGHHAGSEMARRRTAAAEAERLLARRRGGRRHFGPQRHPCQPHRPQAAVPPRAGSTATWRTERSVRHVAPLAPDTGATWVDPWPRPARLLPVPEPIETVALLPDHHRVSGADGPERIFGEWWKHDAETAAVRDYFRVENDTGRAVLDLSRR